MHTAISQALHALETLRGNRALLYCCGGQAGMSKTIEEDDVTPLYECLRRIGTTERLDLVLYTSGGYATVARRIALLLREHAERVTILVPYKARSAGTLLCLSADELVLGPLAELGPLDPHIAMSGDGPAGSPPSISSEDVRAFRTMAERWFGLESEAHRMQVFALLSQRMFPTTLSAFYRNDQQVRQFGEELLRYQLPDADERVVRRLVDQLVSGFHAHDHIITRAEARRLGLRVAASSAEVEDRLWTVWQSYLGYIRGAAAPMPGQQVTVNGVIASTDLVARHVIRWPELTPAMRDGPPSPSMIPQAGWETL